MDKTQHTPTPWYIEDVSTQERNKRGYVYSKIKSGQDTIGYSSKNEIGVYEYKNAKANAAHIVKCVNVHDDLVRQLKVVLFRIECERKIKGKNEAFMLNAQYDDIKQALEKAA